MTGDKPRGWKMGYTLQEIEDELQRKKQLREGVGIFSNQQKKIRNGVSTQVGKTLGQKK